MFDDLLLLAEGREVFHGPADTMLECFEALGHLCPPHFNPAEVRCIDEQPYFHQQPLNSLSWT